MRILRAADHRRMPWKNGGGETTEIAVFPERAGLNEFDWRVSMARVESDGPFSLFAGVDRTLAILEGEGLLLDIAGRDPVEITGASTPLSFPADAPTTASLIGGPIIDVNVMTRRGKLTHRLTRHQVDAPLEIAVDAAETLLLCSSGAVRLSAAGRQAELGHFDAVIFGGGPMAVRVERAGGRAVFHLIEISELS